MEIIAHRGASAYAPENTLAAFQLAEELGADGIELDVHLTKDEVPVIIHDESLNRTTNGSGWVRQYTFAELQQLDAGSWYHARFKGEKLLSLELFLDWLKSRDLFVNIELKTNKFAYPNIEKRVYETIRPFKLNDRIVISSFNPNTIQTFRSLDSSIELAFLTSRTIPAVDEVLQDIGANCMHIKTRLLSSRMIDHLHTIRVPFRVYTVNRRITYKRALRRKAIGIITDRPDLIK